MSKRLILFSGGVESTAMLTKANCDDILVTVLEVYGRPVTGLHLSNIEHIAKYYNKQIHYVKANIPINPPMFVHQMWYLHALTTLWVVKDPDISEVWCGRHSTDLQDPNLRSFIDRMMGIWNLTHPNVPFNHPLDHLTKLEQWELIPDKVKLFVSSCSINSQCGICSKCKEFSELIGDN